MAMAMMVCNNPDYGYALASCVKVCAKASEIAALPSSLSIPVPGCKPLELIRSEMFIRDQRLSIFQPKDVDEVLDMYITQGQLVRFFCAGRLDQDPYWCRIWPSAISIAEEILSHPDLVLGLRVCDLGAGLGLGGLAAAVAGAKEVVLLDREPLALLCAVLNFHVNFPDVTTNLGSLLQLFFPEANMRGLDILLSSPPNKYHPSLQVNGEFFDWTQSHDCKSCYDTVLACDLLYEKSAASCLAKIAPKLLSKRTGARLLLTDPVERTPKHRELFLELVRGTQLTLANRKRRKPEMDGKLHEVELISFEMTQETLTAVVLEPTPIQHA